MYTESFPGSDIQDFDHPPRDPIGLLQQWLPPATDNDPTRTLMALATIGLDGYPNIRHVLASDVTSNGISFHVSSASQKVKELQLVPRAAVTMAWPQEGKQLVIQGDIRVMAAEEAEKTYYQRPRYLQLLAHVNSDDLAQKPAHERKKIWKQFIEDHPEQMPPPDTWLGYQLEPTRISFWRAEADTPNNRHDYLLKDGKWELEIVEG